MINISLKLVVHSILQAKEFRCQDNFFILFFLITIMQTYSPETRVCFNQIDADKLIVVLCGSIIRVHWTLNMRAQLPCQRRRSTLSMLARLIAHINKLQLICAKSLLRAANNKQSLSHSRARREGERERLEKRATERERDGGQQMKMGCGLA